MPLNQLWMYSGVPAGKAGTLRPSSNASACLDATVKGASLSHPDTPTTLAACVPGALSQQWRYSGDDGHLSSVMKLRPMHGSKDVNVSRCLDTLQGHVGVVDLWDCKDGDANQVWALELQAGGAAGQLRAKARGVCLEVSPLGQRGFVFAQRQG